MGQIIEELIASVYSKKGDLLGTVDRSINDEVLVLLTCGFKARFWITDLTNNEYIKRTIKIKKFVL
jgi:hypothetical protein